MSKIPFLFLLTLIQPLVGQTATIEGRVKTNSINATLNVVVDSDRDGLTDPEEAALTTDLNRTDSDGDGISDKNEVDAKTDPLLNQFLANPDGAGLKNIRIGNDLTNGLRALWGFETIVGRQFLDTSRNGFHGTISENVTSGPGTVSKSGLFPAIGSFMTISPNLINDIPDKTKLTFSFWYKQAPVTSTWFRTIFSHQLGNGETVSIAYRIHNGIPFIAFIRNHVNLVSKLSTLTEGVAFIPRVGSDNNINSQPMRLDDDKWHHIILRINGNIKTFFIDGDFTMPSQSHTVSLEGVGINTFLGKFSTFNSVVGIEGELDQFTIYSRVLADDEMQALWNYDADNDGMTNREELASGNNPFVFENDFDRDGLTNAEELAGQATFNGVSKVFMPTDRNRFDTDGDLFDDYWEAKYYWSGRVDPNNRSVPAVADNLITLGINESDYDGDGLSNSEELRHSTDPNNSDTDRDGMTDKKEADYGSSATDASEMAMDPRNFYGVEGLSSFSPIGDLGAIVRGGGGDAPVVTVNVGNSLENDPTGYNTETWRLHVGDKKVTAPSSSAMSGQVKLTLATDRFHEVYLSTVGTSPGYTKSVDHDYHYKAAVETGKSPFLLCDINGYNGLNSPILGSVADPVKPHKGPVDPLFQGANGAKKAYLVPLDNFSWSTSFSGGDAVGPRHRKIALNGRPLTDENPEQEEESDLPSEQTFIDAFNLSLNYDTTFHYTSLGSSDLVLQASASISETSFSNRSGLRPHERFDLPFGAGWSSNLCSYVEVVETIGDDSGNPVSVNVIDEAGRSQRFGTRDFGSFFPWPSTRVDKKTYLNTLTRNGTNFTLQKKFGNTLTYTKAKTWFMYSTDRVEGSTKVRRHTYWRLAEACDRYGVRLRYDYDTAPGVPNDVTLIPRQISSPDRQGQFLVIKRTPDSRRVESITDSRGNTTTFDYGNTPTTGQLTYEGPVFVADIQVGQTSEPVTVPRLQKVTYADLTTTSYTYNGGLVEATDVTDPKKPTTTRHYHTNLKSVTDKRQNTHTFNYGFDLSKQYWDSNVNGTRAAINLNRLPPGVKSYVETQLEKMNGEANGSWKTMYGMPRKITSVILPGGIGTAGFVSQGQTRFGQTVSFPQAPGTTVTDADGKVTVYAFETLLAEIVDVDTTAQSVSADWMVYYLTSKIHHGGAVGAPGHVGTETYQFDPKSGLSLWRATDMSNNVTTWEFENNVTQPLGLGKKQPSLTMTKWADPTAKVDALNRRETYSYNNSFRVMDGIDDVFDTTTIFSVDILGRRQSKDVLQGGVTPLSKERYDYGNQRFKAFKTLTTTVAFANASSQPWEKNLVTQHLPDNNGRPWREIVDPGGENIVTEHAYDFNSNRTSTLDPRGKRTRFKYDKLNRLVEITFPSAGTRDGNRPTTKQIWYNKNGNKAAEIDEEGNYTIHHYDALNRLITTIRDMDRLGLPTRTGLPGEELVTEENKGSVTGNDLLTRFAYNPVGALIRQTDPRGIVTRTFYDSIQRPIHVFTGLSSAEGSDSLQVCITAAAASTEKTHTEFTYDLAKNSGSTAFASSGFKPTTIIRHQATLAATGTPLLLRTFAAYDALYRPLRTDTEYRPNTFAVSTFSYGAIVAAKEGLQTTSTDDRGKATRTVMDGLQRPTSVMDAFATNLVASTQTLYSSTGLVWKTVDPLLRASETEYDAAGRPVIAWMPDPVTGVVNRAAPDDPLLGSPRTQTFYDKSGNVTASLNPLGKRWEYEFDGRNRRTLERHPTVTPDKGVLQHPTIQTAYDGVGNTISLTSARGHTTRSVHDRAYRVTDMITNPVTGNPSFDPDSLGANDILTETFYDPNGNATQVVDGNGSATRNTYDGLNRLRTTTTNPDTGQPSSQPSAPSVGDITVTNDYDDSGNLTRVSDGKVQLTGFRYDGLGRKTRTLWDVGSALERIEQTTYDGIVLLSRTDPKQQVTNFQYDFLNRLKDVLYTNDPTNNRRYAYDLVGNLEAVTQPNDTAPQQLLRNTGQLFDKLNRITQETSAGAAHVHTYDKAGNRRTTTYAASGRFLTSTYDSLNRLQTCVEKPASTSSVINLTSYGYDLNGNVTRKVLPNNSVSVSTFDAVNRKLGETTRTATGGLVSSFDYSQASGSYPTGYDKVGNLLKSVEQYGNTSVKNRTVANVYDRAHRLFTETIAEIGGATVTSTYLYDAANNRTSKVVSGGANPGAWASSYGTLAEGYNSNQLKSVTKSGVVTSFLYDANGNRSSKKVGTATVQTYGYDFENRLVSVADTTKGTFAYRYDHRTRRVGRDETSASGLNTKLSFSGGLSVQEYTIGADTPTVENIRGSDYGGGIGGVLYTIRGGSTRSYNAYNSRGDVVSKTNDGGTITWQSSYEAFGMRTQEQGATADRQKANTKDEDPTGLLNEGFRYRDLEFGIFLTRDPAGFVDGPNVYTYVRQNPWTKFDPHGLWEKEVFAATISAAGRMASDIGHGVVQAGLMVELGARAAVGGDTSGASGRLEAVTNHAESFGGDISRSNATVYGADVNSAVFENTQLVAGILIPEPGSKIKAVSKADDIATIIKKGGEKMAGVATSAKKTAEESAEAAAKSIPDQRSASGSMLDPSDKSGKLTIAGRALDKHGSSQGKRAESSSFPTSKGNKAAKNQQGQDQLDDILTDPNQGSFPNGKGGADVHAGDGRGARFDSDDKFKGFLEPRR